MNDRAIKAFDDSAEVKRKEELFARQVTAHDQKGAIAISTSGNSPNVLKGVAAAKVDGLITIGWTGGTSGKLAGMRWVAAAFVRS